MFNRYLMNQTGINQAQSEICEKPVGWMIRPVSAHGVQALQGIGIPSETLPCGKTMMPLELWPE